MALNKPIFLNGWDKGSSENANIGFGTMLGVETYSKKGVAQLTKDTTLVSSTIVTDLVVSFTSRTSSNIFSQGNTGKVYSSSNSGTTWVDISPPSLGAGGGIIYFQGFLLAWRGGNIDYCVSPYTSADWTQGWQTGLVSRADGGNFPFLFPNDGAIYFTNGNKMGKIFFGTALAFNPATSATLTINYGTLIGTFSIGNTVTDTVTGATATIVTDNGSNLMTVKNIVGTPSGSFNATNSISNSVGATAVVTSLGTASTYFYNPALLTLPDYYQVNCISFLPANYLALGTGGSGIGGNAQQICDLILWNPTLSTYETPLRLFSQAGTGAGGINQIINRNNVLYAVTGGNHAIFSTNGTSFNLVDDISLHTTARLLTGTGVQATASVFLNQFPSALAVLGHKILTGVSTSINSVPSGYGLFPLGVWSETFSDGSFNGSQASSESNNIQCEFPISTGTIVSNTNYNIGALYPIAQAQVLIGWQDGSNFGIDVSNFTTFQTDPTVVQIESEMTEIGTPLEPQTIETVQINLVRSLIAGQTLSVYWRTAFDQPYALLETFNAADGDVQLNNSLKTTKNAIGSTKFIQLRINMSTGSPNEAWTPEIRTIVIE